MVKLVADYDQRASYLPAGSVLLTLRRGSDGVTRSFQTDGRDLPVSEITSWLSGAPAYVVGWNSLAAPAKQEDEAGQPTLTLYPGYTAVTYSGDPLITLQSNSGVDLAEGSNKTIIAAFRPDMAQNKLVVPWYAHNVVWDEIALFAEPDGGGLTRIGFESWNEAGTLFQSVLSSFSAGYTNKLLLVEAVLGGAGAAIRINGYDDTASHGDFGIIPRINGPCNLGDNNTLLDIAFKGDIVSVFVYEGVLSKLMRAALTKYLYRRYGTYLGS